MKFLFLFFLLAVPSLGAFDMAEAVKEQVLRDEVVASVIEDADGVGIEAIYMIRRPIDRVWALLKDFDFYKKVYTEYKSIAVVSEGPEGMTIDYVMKFPLKKIEYTLLRVYLDDRFSWKLVEGEDFRRLDGEYQLMSLDTDCTALRYRSFIRMKSKVVGLFKDRFALKQTKKSILDFKKAAERE
jgi:ribosome-associated toxin RatA of RatAB toxin-antitoxin module